MSTNSQDECRPASDIPARDIYSKISDLAEKMGASQVCKQAALNDAANFSSSGGVSASGYGMDAEGHYQVSGGASHSTMEQSGCGPIMLAAQKIISNTKQIQCILQRTTKKTNTNIVYVNSLSIRGPKISEAERMQINSNIEKLIAEYKRENPFSEYYQLYNIMIEKYNASVEKYNEKYPNSKREFLVPSIEDVRKAYNSGIEAIQNAFGYDLVWKNVSVNQTMTGSIQLIGQLSDEDKMQIESLSQDIAKTVAETDLKQKSGVGALTPSAKQALDSTIESNKNIQGTQIASKIAEINRQISGKNVTEIVASGRIYMENVRFDQNLAIDLMTQDILTSSIDAGMKAASMTLLSNETKQKMEQESQGVEAIIKAQGEANAAAIKAAQTQRSIYTVLGSLISLGFLGLILYFENQYAKQGRSIPLFSFLNIFKFIFIAGFVAGLSLLVYFLVYDKNPLQGKLINRPLSVYQSYWEALGCDKKLTEDDIKSWDHLTDMDVSTQMQFDYDSAKKNPNSIYGAKCFANINATTTTAAPTTTSIPTSTNPPSTTQTVARAPRTVYFDSGRGGEPIPLTNSEIKQYPGGAGGIIIRNGNILTSQKGNDYGGLLGGPGGQGYGSGGGSSVCCPSPDRTQKGCPIGANGSQGFVYILQDDKLFTSDGTYTIKCSENTCTFILMGGGACGGYCGAYTDDTKWSEVYRGGQCGQIIVLKFNRNLKDVTVTVKIGQGGYMSKISGGTDVSIKSYEGGNTSINFMYNNSPFEYKAYGAAPPNNNVRGVNVAPQYIPDAYGGFMNMDKTKYNTNCNGGMISKDIIDNLNSIDPEPYQGQ